MARVVASTRMSAAGWTAFDEGFINAYEWSQALAGGAAMPQEAAPVQLGPGEVAHARIAPVGISGLLRTRTSSTDRRSS